MNLNVYETYMFVSHMESLDGWVGHCLWYKGEKSTCTVLGPVMGWVQSMGLFYSFAFIESSFIS